MMSRFFLWTIGLSLLGAFVLWIFSGMAMFRYPGAEFDRGKHAVWAEHAWVEPGRSLEEISAFMRRLATHHVRYVFVHVGPLLPDGSLPEGRFERVRDFVRLARADNARLGHDVDFLGWVGQLRGKIALQDPAVRARAVATGRKLLTISELDGIHYDIEPVAEGDEGFLALLSDTREMMRVLSGTSSKSKLLSVALPETLPEELPRFFFTDTTYRQSANLVDQLVVMTYENSIADPFWYRLLVKYQVIWLTRMVDRTRILIGIPTYDTPSPTFHPEAENIENGILGTLDGLNAWRTRRSAFEGVALYGFWTTSDAEWATFDRLFGIR